jgi:hypothetical protein
MHTLKLAGYPSEAPKIDEKGRGAGYGLDAELSQKLANKYDATLEAQAQAWIEAVSGQKFGGKTFGEALKDGKILCATINAIRPGTIKKVNKMNAPFMMMENICHFLKGCRTLGVNGGDCFETVDLFEAKDLGLVVACIHALGRAVQKSCPEWDGPTLGPKEAEKNVRCFSAAQLNAGKGIIGKVSAGSSKTMEKLDVTKTGITFGADNANTEVGANSNVVPILGLGSKGIMERSEVKKAGITFGADNTKTEVGANSNVVPILGLGSKGIMERSEVKKTGITFGADSAGAAEDCNSVPQLGLGSKGIMERKELSKPGITFGADATAQTSEQQP